MAGGGRWPEKVGSVQEMRVVAVGVEAGASRPVLLLEEASGEHRLLPVWIGAAEANMIMLEQHGVSGPRPVTHHLIGHVLASFGRRLEQVRITEVRDNIFYAELVIDRGTRVSARVSDAVALALHLRIPVHADDAVLDAAAVANTVIHVEGEDRAQADEVEEFRRFLHTASPEDFDTE
jgi:bifunctional DNase/RNase